MNSIVSHDSTPHIGGVPEMNCISLSRHVVQKKLEQGSQDGRYN